jgi:hypothetical protein
MDQQAAGLAVANECDRLITQIEEKLYAMMETVERIDRLISAHRGGDPVEVERALHELKASSAT